jgi:magnesium chelatase family protein
MLSDRAHVETTSVVADRVAAARERTRARLAGTPWQTNAEVPIGVLRRGWPIPLSALSPLRRRLDLGLLSARGLDRIIRVAWTVADLAGLDRPRSDEIAYAQFLRTGVHERVAC